jgi:arsenate reductase
MDDFRIYTVLFLCTGNSARSIMAEAIMNNLSINRGRFRAFSAGSHPRGEVHVFARDLLAATGHSVRGLRSKSWDAFAQADAPAMDFVFTVCDDAAGEACPVWPGQPMTAHWGMPDPAAATGTEAERRYAFAEAYRHLSNRIGIFVNLPIHSIADLTLRQRLAEIGGAAPVSGAM